MYACVSNKFVTTYFVIVSPRGTGISIGNLMFLEMQDFDFCSNLTKFTQIFPKFYPGLPKKFARGFGHIPYIPSSHATGYRYHKNCFFSKILILEAHQ